MKIKRVICSTIALIFLFLPVLTSAAFEDVPQDALYAQAVERISALGIINGMGDGSFQPEGSITREQFAALIVKAEGLEDTAKSLAGATIFPDVDPFGWSAGYINVALNKGYISGMADGKFHPEESITFAQACTILVKALGYTEQDVTGLWPKNYIEKAKVLGLTSGINLSSNDALPRWAAAVMIDSLLVTDMKTAAGGTAKSFADASGLYTEGIILATSSTLDKLAGNQVLTDKGTFYVAGDGIKLDLGSKYKLVVKNEVILNAYNVTAKVLNISVDSAVGTKITYREEGKTKTMTLPEKTAYYYNGVKQNYDALNTVLQTRTSIVFAYNSEKTGFEYAVIVDPVYSEPNIIVGGVDNTDLPWGLPVVCDGKVIGMYQIEDRDIVYKVSDIWGGNKYLQVLKNRVTGEISGFLPGKMAPKTVQIDGASYEIGKNMNINKLNNTAGSFKIGDRVTALLGNKGEIVDVLYADSEDNSNFAFVINYSYSTSTNVIDYGKTQYTVKLLHTDGSTVTYKTESDPSPFKGRLVTFEKKADDEVSLVLVPYNAYGDATIKVDDGKIDNDYVTSSVKVFNLIENKQGVDARVNLIDWKDMPYGKVASGKILFGNKVGSFEDINVIVTNDIFDQNGTSGIVKKITSSRNNIAYTIVADGTERTYTTNTYLSGIPEGSVVTLNMKDSTVESLALRNYTEQGYHVQAIDSKRIKLNGKVYEFKENLIIYMRDYLGNVEIKGINDINTNKSYAGVIVYTDKSVEYGGKVDVLVINNY